MLVGLAGWMNREQQEVIEYFREENRILREKLGARRIILNDAQRRRLATAAAKLGRVLLRQVGPLFSPETLLGWFRTLVARKYDGSNPVVRDHCHSSDLRLSGSLIRLA